MVGRAAIDVVLEEVRSGLDRVEPADLASEVAAGALVLDTRPVEQRQWGATRGADHRSQRLGVAAGS